ncbi:MAG: hypothetical protein ACRDD1_11655, partial [Planctomycetia bacterium]
VALLPDAPSLDELPGWRATAARYDALHLQQGLPVLVATLYGPTGAGKSTLFRLLTGVDVPAGEFPRPMSYACAAAVPDAYGDESTLAAVFPGFRMERMDAPDRLRLPDERLDRLLFTTYQSESFDPGALPLVLVDVPDFNSVETTNWEKAERVLRRADVVLFVVYGNGYADRRTIDELARCCRTAGALAYLFTKVDPNIAGQMWDDLRRKTAGLAAFQEPRADGRTLARFLADCPAYVSPLQSRPALAAISTLSDGAPTFTSLVAGLDGRAVVFASLATPAVDLARAVKPQAAQVRREAERLTVLLERAAAAVRRSVAEPVAYGQFPAGRVLQLIREVSKETQNSVSRFLLSPFQTAAGFLGGAARGLQEMFQGQPDVRPREEAENAAFDDRLPIQERDWLNEYPAEATPAGLFSAERLRTARAALFATPAPAPLSNWEVDVRTALHGWARANPGLNWLLYNSPALLSTVGLGAVVADLMLTGGLVGTVGLPAIAGVGGIAGGKLMEWLNSYQLQTVAEGAQKAWSKQRSDELHRHLEKHWIDELFRPWRQRRDALAALPTAALEAAADDLVRLGDEARRTP